MHLFILIILWLTLHHYKRLNLLMFILLAAFSENCMAVEWHLFFKTLLKFVEKIF